MAVFQFSADKPTANYSPKSTNSRFAGRGATKAGITALYSTQGAVKLTEVQPRLGAPLVAQRELYSANAGIRCVFNQAPSGRLGALHIQGAPMGLDVYLDPNPWLAEYGFAMGYQRRP